MYIFKSPASILTPCIGICILDKDGFCKGCRRTGEEIARWMTMSDVERARLMNDVLPQREVHGRPP